MSSTFGACKTHSQVSFHGWAYEHEQGVSSNARKRLAWPAMVIAGLTLGGYVLTSWPDAHTPAAKAQPQRATAPQPARTLASASRPYSGDLMIYELESTLLVDSITAAPQRVDAH
ncbi:MAG TPA: hypothetical protein VM049_10245 [Gaiellaceae bacterium]|nr:hypothetical protein [Gaiellaceae bacterium]